MASITSWTRLEPDSRDAEFESGLQARLHDPLWTIARQWQVGEFEGEDNGSPVAVEVTTELRRLARLRLGPPEAAQSEPYDATLEPLEVLVEREPVLASNVQDAAPSLHLRFETGLHFLQLLELAGVGRYRTDYIGRYALSAPEDGIDIDARTRRYVEMYRLRVPDGPDLYADLRRAFPTDDSTGGMLPAFPRIEVADRSAVAELIVRWLKWYETSFSEPPSQGERAWNPSRLEYSFGVEADGPDGGLALEANEYAGGELDWYAFEDRPELASGAPTPAAVETVVHHSLPAPVVYRAMPAARWWEFEDAFVNLGSVDAAADDVLRMLMLDFALRFSNDWFVAPLEQPVGSFCRIAALVVTDCFGQRTLVESAATADGDAADWRMFTVTGDASRSDIVGHFLAPALPSSLHSPPIERVQFLRDEIANMAWAVEQIVQAPSGHPRRRDEERPPTTAVEPGEDLGGVPLRKKSGYRYRLGRGPAAHWTPLVPVRQADDDPSIRLRRGRVIQPDGDEIGIPVPLGRILDAARPLDMFEEEVPRSGVEVIRHYQRVRWSDGSTHTWAGRRTSIGARPATSNLRFDILDSQTTPLQE